MPSRRHFITTTDMLMRLSAQPIFMAATVGLRRISEQKIKTRTASGNSYNSAAEFRRAGGR